MLIPLKKLGAIMNDLNEINEEQKIIMPLHPHTRDKIQEYKIRSNIGFIEPLGYLSMLSLLKKCDMVITDSGGLQKESFCKEMYYCSRPNRMD